MWRIEGEKRAKKMRQSEGLFYQWFLKLAKLLQSCCEVVGMLHFQLHYFSYYCKLKKALEILLASCL